MVESNNAINNTVGASISGVTNTLTVTNPSDTASSAARATITVGGSSAADPSLNFNVNGVTDFEMGIDNGASDSFKISASSSLGTTDTFIMTTAGERTMPLQPAFLAVLPSTDTNATGNGTTFQIGSNVALTEIFDQGGDFTTAGVFTAPVTGRYHFDFYCTVITLTASHNQERLEIDTSNRNFETCEVDPIAVRNKGAGTGFSGSLLCDMDAADTTTFAVTVNGGAKTVDVRGTASSIERTYISGHLCV